MQFFFEEWMIQLKLPNATTKTGRAVVDQSLLRTTQSFPGTLYPLEVFATAIVGYLSLDAS